MTTTQVQLADARGNHLGTRSGAARDAVERALWRMMSFYEPPIEDLDRAIAEDPGWTLPHVMVAGFLASLTEPSLLADARGRLAVAQALADRAPPRERAHLEAVDHLLAGRPAAACKLWDAILIDHPRDALALQWAHLWDFHRGDAINLRARPARCLPEWSESDPLFPHVLALHAFGLEENNLHAQAEEAGRRALALEPRAPWAVHAVAHVMEMQGRFDDGTAWLRQHQPGWAEGNGFSAHLWWHMGLFRLEGLDEAGVLRLLDTHLAGGALQITIQRLDAASMLWRLHVLGADVSARSAALLDAWPLPDEHAGHHAFNDLHAVLAMLAAGEPARADAWVARCAQRALSAEPAGNGNHAVAREIGLPLMRGLLAYGRGEFDAAAHALYALRGQLGRIGGSQAQRDLVDQTLLACGVHGTQAHAIARAVFNERRLAKPPTPLTRHWADQLRLAVN
jgi:tetratricopeptide (TPR) repeat protein